YSLEIINIARSELGIEIDIDVACSAGTYIRAIARDLGVALKVGGHLIELRRSEVAPFSLAEAVTLESVSQSNLLDIVEVAKQVLPSRVIDLLEKNELKFGRSLPASEFSGVGIAITGDNELCALIENRNSGAQPIAVFVKE
ncbi:MAG: tRNA pseudouridine(55) synthase TruB, partial [Actinobacteria bacterium]|nr:tRNA pseudouridine(55) synthase TruB [Actinomycetota bacterium]